jgi:hypothetical protein
MNTRLTKKEILEQFELRKSVNFILIQNIPIEIENKGENLKGCIPITRNEKGEVSGSFCSYCHEYLPSKNPWSTGVYIFPTCKECTLNASYIENRNNQSKNKKRRTKNYPEDVTVDWVYVDRMIDNSQAKLGLLANKYNLENTDMRKLIIQHYQDRVTFKRGRAGGIMWNTCNKKRK